MVFDQWNDCCIIAAIALNGVLSSMYGWVAEAIAIVFAVFIFNFLMKRILNGLHLHFAKQKNNFQDSFVQAIHKPLSYYAWFFAAVQAVDAILTHSSASFHIGIRQSLLAVGAVLALAWFLLKWKNNVVSHLLTKSKNREITIDQGKIGAIDKIWTVAIIFFIILIMLEATDRSMNTIIAFGSVGGLALAFASQEIIANFFGGFMIYLTQPFTVGDWISIPGHSIEGVVEDIGWYMTRLRSTDKRPIYIPNSIFSKLIVITPSRMSHRQFKEVIGLRYEDMPKVKAVIHEIEKMLKEHSDIDHFQSIIVRLSSFGSYSLDITVIAYIPVIDYQHFMEVKEDILFKIAAILTNNDAELAVPMQNIAVMHTPQKDALE